MHEKVICFFHPVICFHYSDAQPPTDPRLKGLDTFVAKVLKDWNAAGVSIAVVEKNKVVYTVVLAIGMLKKNCQ